MLELSLIEAASQFELSLGQAWLDHCSPLSGAVGAQVPQLVVRVGACSVLAVFLAGRFDLC